MMLLTLICRAFFGTVEGVVGWVPYLGRLLEQPIHRIEQRVSHLIGGAVKPIDRHIATHWHSLAQVIRSIPSQLLDDAALLFGLAAALVVLPSISLVKYLIRVATAPLRSAVRELEHDVVSLRSGARALRNFVRHSVWARLLALAALVSGIAHELPHLRARERALEQEIAKLRDWVRHRKISLTTGAFLGAFVWALTKLGLRWIRCSNVRKVGNRLCHMSPSLLDELLGIALAAELVIDPEAVARAALGVEDTFERFIKRIAD
jgi:hypothetical protein